MEQKRLYTITECNTCKFYAVTMDGRECTHPYWDDKSTYQNMIITNPNIIPEKCPLKIEPLTRTYTYCISEGKQ